jgi:uncharacterized protein YqjF (DUF2071 family)
MSIVNLHPLSMWWRDVAFFHYRVEPDIIARSLPDGVEPDCFDGSAWLSVVPFRMTGIHLRGLPVLPGFNAVPEINLRTYVRVRDRPGIWFYSLDATSVIVVDSARVVTALPYFRARVVTAERNGTIRYESERHDRRAVAGNFRAEYRPSVESRKAEAGSLDAFLHERYRFFSVRGSRLLTADVQHEPWALQTLEAEIAENTLGATIGYPLPLLPEIATFGRGVRVTASLTTTA